MIKTIILEGVNGSGKTTTGQLLSEVLDLQVVHAGPRPNSHQEALERSENEITNLSLCDIRDRCNCISHLVYHDNLSLSTMYRLFNDIDKILEKSIIVYCVGQGVNQPKDYYTEEHKKEIVDNHKLYREKYESIMTAIPHIRFDFNTMRLHDLVAAIDAVK